MSIATSWEEYFLNHYEGLGTTYERFVLHRYFERLYRNGDVRSVLEAPSFGMTGISGINSMWWALHGANVVVADSDSRRLSLVQGVWNETGINAGFVVIEGDWAMLPFDDMAFDFSWNFAALWQVHQIGPFLAELARVTSKAIMICIPNASNIMSFFNRAAGSSVEGGQSRPTVGWNALLSHGWNLAESGFFDVPPWPDIAMKKEDLLRKIGFKRFGNKLERERKDGMCILDYYRGTEKELESGVLKYGFLENLPSFIKRLWAHHRYFVFRRGI